MKGVLVCVRTSLYLCASVCVHVCLCVPMCVCAVNMSVRVSRVCVLCVRSCKLKSYKITSHLVPPSPTPSSDYTSAPPLLETNNPVTMAIISPNPNARPHLTEIIKEILNYPKTIIILEGDVYI